MFRFAFLLILLETFPGALWRLPFARRLAPGWHALIDKRIFGPVVRVAMRGLGLQSTGFTHGDSTYALVALLCLAIIAALAAVAWTSWDYPRQDDDRLHAWLRVYVRFYTGAMLLNYGIEKLLLHQMGYPPLPNEMLRPVAQLAPARLLWVFMAASPVYQMFAGAAEALAGAFLMFRRTTLLGALLGVAAMTNVVVMNYSYHVSVLYLATELLVLCAVLVLPDAARLFNFVVLGKAVGPSATPPLFDTPRYARAASVIGAVFASWVVVSITHDYYIEVDSHYQPRPIFAGAYSVASFQRNGLEIQPLATDAQRWRYFTVDSRWSAAVSGSGTIQFMPDSVITRFLMKVDSVAHTISFRTLFGRDTSWVTWRYSRPDSLTLSLDGTDFARRGGPNTDSLRVALRWLDLSKTPLLRPRVRFP